MTRWIVVLALVAGVASAEEPAPSLGTPAAAKETPVTKDSVIYKAEEGELNWGLHEGGKTHVGVEWMMSTLPDRDYDPGVGQRNLATQGLLLSSAWFPVTKYGRFGVGPLLGYRRVSKQETSGSGIQMFSAGAKAVYELCYLESQWVVPFVEGSWERVRMKGYTLDRRVNSQGAQIDPGRSVAGDTFDAPSYGGGLMVFMNKLEPNTAAKALASTGIKKYYLAWTMKFFDGWSHHLGFRFEF